MPDQESTHQYQRACVWDFAGYGTDGKPVVRTFFREIGVRWNNRQAEGMDADLETDEEIDIDSIVYEGSQTDLEALLPGTGTGTDIEPTAELTDLFVVATREQVTDVRGRATAWGYGLKRHSAAMPDQV